MDGQAVRSLLERLTACNVQVLRKPETGLVMMNVTDCFTTDFHLGEVLVTTAEVTYAGRRGWGMIMGDEADRALLLAVLDALPIEREDSLVQEVRNELHRWYEQAITDNENEQRLAAVTRVNFETMTPEN